VDDRKCSQKKERANLTLPGETTELGGFAWTKSDRFCLATSDRFVWKATPSMIPGKVPVSNINEFTFQDDAAFFEMLKNTNIALEFYSETLAHMIPFSQLNAPDGP